MPSVPKWFKSGALGVTDGSIALASAPIKVMITTSTYTPDQLGHTRRSHVTDEVTGTGYTAGGKLLTGVAFSFNDPLIQAQVGWDPVLWTPPTAFTGRNIVGYVDRGGLASADELLFYIVFPFDFTAGGAGLELALANPVLSLALVS